MHDYSLLALLVAATSVFFDQPIVESTAAALVVMAAADALLKTTFGVVWTTRRPWLANVPFFLLILVVALYWLIYVVT